MQDIRFNTVAWIAYGFVFLKSVDAVLRSLLEGFFHYGLYQGFYESHFQLLTPVLSLWLYFSAAVLIFFCLRKQFRESDTFLTRIHIGWFIVFTVIGFGLNPLTEHLSNRLLELTYEDLSLTYYLSGLNFNRIDEIFEFSLTVSGIVSVPVLYLLWIKTIRPVTTSN